MKKTGAMNARWILAAILALGIGAHSVSVRAEDAAPAPAKKSKYKRSRLTSDESEGTADRRRMLLTTGEDKAVDLDFDANGGANGIAIGNPQIVTTTLVKIGDKRQIVFKPLKTGETTVTVRDADGTLRLIFMVRVTGSSLLRVAGEVRSLLRDIEGIDIRIVGSKVIIEGEVLVPADYGRLLNVVTDKVYAEHILNMAMLSPLAMQVLSKRIQEDINAFAPNVKTRVVNGMIFLEGQVDTQDMANRATRVATLYLPELRPGSPLEKDPSVQRLEPRKLIQSFLIINPPPPKKASKLVRVSVHFVELSKDYGKVFGFKWQPGFTADPQISVGTNGAGAAGATGASFSGTISSLIPTLQSAQQAGYARILKTGTLIVKSGQNAEFADQTEIPYPSQASSTTGAVQWNKEKVGLTLAVTPTILGQSEDIDMDLKLVQSNVVGRAIAGSAPLTSSHKVETKIYVKSSESAAVAGLNASDVGTDFNKDDPNTGSFDQGTKPLFTLMRSKAYRKKKSQFVIFITPQIVDNASDGTEDMKKNFRVKVK